MFQLFWSTIIIKINISGKFSMTQSVKFFNTQIDLQRSRRHSPVNGSYNALLKVKQLKQHVRKLDEVYKRALSSKTRTEKSISQLHKSAQKVRVDFLKFYQNKKAKLINRQKVQKLQAESKEHLSEVHRKTKQRKLLGQYQMLTTKNEEHQNNQFRQERNKKDKQKLEKEIKLKSLEATAFAKGQYQKIKQEKESVAERNKRISEILSMRSHINYVEQVEKQLAQIKLYEDLLNDVAQNQEIMQEVRPSTTASKSFFITTRRMISTRQSRGAHTSHTAR